MSQFEPIIVAFACHYCAYSAADVAGSMRLEYPANIKIVKLPCSGKLDSIHVMRALQKGADGVLVAGCLTGDCHFKTGNIRAAKKVRYVQGLLKDIGLEPERVSMIELSAGQGAKFAELATNFTESIRELGPNPIKQGSAKAAA